MIKLKEYRKKCGYTQTELGRLVGVAKSTMSQYENGSREPDIETLKRFSDILCVSIDKLLDRPETSQDDALEIRERLRSDYNYRMLFSAAKTAKSDHLRAAAAMLKALETEEQNAD